jgi:adenylate kinase
VRKGLQEVLPAAKSRGARTAVVAAGPRLAVVLLGPPGAGKGTQARKIGEFFGYPRVSTGDMLREAVSRETALGKKARSHIESGGLVPDSLVDAMVRARLRRRDCASGFVLDGYPRTLHQAEFLERLFPDGELRTVAIGIDVDDDVLVGRLAGRWTCPNCGKIFNSASNPSRDGKRCDECDTVLVHRADDAADVVRERLQVYHHLTEPLIRHYQRRGRFHRIDGGRSVEAIFGSLKRTIEKQRQPGPARVAGRGNGRMRTA